MSMLSKLSGFFCTCFMGLWTLFCSIRFVVSSYFPGFTQKKAQKHVIAFSKGLFYLSKSRLEIHNLSGWDLEKESFIIMSNHASFMDIPALFLSIKKPIRMVAKSELQAIPFFGKSMRHLNMIFIDRHLRTKAILQLQTVKKSLKPGDCIWISPEGTRNTTKDPLLPFKKGGFHLALDLDLPILPVWISGSQSVLPAKSLITKRGKTIQVYMGKPIFTQNKTLPELMEETQKALQGLAES